MEGCRMKKIRMLIVAVAVASLFVPSSHMNAMKRRNPVVAGVEKIEESMDEIVNAKTDKIKRVFLEMFVHNFGVNALNSSGKTLLMLAKEREDNALVGFLIAQGADRGSMSLESISSAAAVEEDNASMRSQIEQGADTESMAVEYIPNAAESEESAPENDIDRAMQEIFSVPIRDGDLRARQARTFIDLYGVNRLSGKGETLLLIAMKHRDFATGEMLLDEGADPNVADKESMTPLMFAVIKENLSCKPKGVRRCTVHNNIEELLYSRYRRHHVDALCLKFGEMSRANEIVIQKIIEAGADVNQVNKYGYTALMYAVMFDASEAAIELLLQKSTSKTINKVHQDIYGIFLDGQKDRKLFRVNPLRHAVGRNAATASLLIKYGADPRLKSGRLGCALDDLQNEKSEAGKKKISDTLMMVQDLVKKYFAEQDCDATLALESVSALRNFPVPLLTMIIDYVPLFSSHSRYILTGGYADVQDALFVQGIRNIMEQRIRMTEAKK